MVSRILVVYASRAGSTAEIAKDIGNEIARAGAAVDVRAVGEVTDLGEYTAVVIGGPLYMGRVVSEIELFVRKNQAALELIPVAAFVVGGSLTDRSEKSLAWARGLMEKALGPVTAREIGLFAGYLNTSRMSFSQQMIIRCTGGKPGDFRDWEMIREWARQLPGKLGRDLPHS
jgi:menaquinone-dependent protoporphyrinogen oxidase